MISLTHKKIIRNKNELFINKLLMIKKPFYSLFPISINENDTKTHILTFPKGEMTLKTALTLSPSFEIKKKWINQILNGVKELHSLNIIHGDISSQNILIFPNDQIKIIDFGLSSHPEERCVSKNFFYTTLYRPFECWENPGYCSKESDIFALAILISEILDENPLKKLYPRANISKVENRSFILDFVKSVHLSLLENETILNKCFLSEKNRIDVENLIQKFKLD